MKSTLLRVLCLGSVMLLWTVTSGHLAAAGIAEEESPEFTAVMLESFLDGVVQGYMEKYKIAGVTLSIVKDEAIILEKGYGIRDIDPQTEVNPRTTLFRFGSAGKTFTWTAIMQLVEAGILSINDPINGHLPDALKIPDDGFEEPIRIWHLMTHTTGFEDVRLGHVLVLSRDKLRPLNDYLAAVRPHRVQEPGVITSYSNYATGLAGAIVAEVSGESYFDYIENHIIKPLGMTHTTFREPHGGTDGSLGAPMPEELEKNMSGGFVWKGGTWQKGPFEYASHCAPAGSGSTTAHDMAQYMMAHLGNGEFNGVRILEPETARRMHKSLYTPVEGIDSMAHGFIEYTLPGGYKAYGHPGGTLQFLTNMLMIPELNLGIFVSANTLSAGALVIELPGILLNHFFPKEEKESSPKRDLSGDLARFEGRYASNRNSHTKLEKLYLSLLTGYINVSVSEDNELILSTKSGASRWVPIGSMTFRHADKTDKIGFLQDDKGQITHLILASNPEGYDRVGYFSSFSWLALAAVVGLIISVLTVLGLVIDVLFRRKRKRDRAPAGRMAVWILCITSSAWIAVFVLFYLSIRSFVSNPLIDFADFPSSILISGCVVGVVFSIFSFASAVFLIPVWKLRMRPLWQRIWYSIATLIFLVIVVTLNHWNVIGFKYF